MKSMNNKILYIVSLFLYSLIFAQSGKVGIGTNNPQQVLHIDAAKNTVAGANISDDVVVTSQGYMGIGTVTPSKRLEINNTTPGAVKIVDGTQKQNAFLMSNANGVGSWHQQSSIKPTVLGVWNSSLFISSDNTGGTKNLSVSIDLTPGVWVVNFGATFKMGNNVSPYWLHLYLSDSTGSRTKTTFDFLGSGGNNTGYAGLMTSSKTVGIGNANLISGSSVIRVNQNTKIWVLAENIYSTSPAINWNFSGGNWENYFYAIPLEGN